MGSELNLAWSMQIHQVEAKMRKLEKLNEKQIAQINRLTAASKRAGTAASRAGRASGRAMGGMARSAVTAVASWVSIQQVIALARRELDHYLTVQDRSKTATLSAAEAELIFTTNLAAKTEAQQTAALERLEDIARDKGVSHTDVLRRAAIAISSKGQLTDEQMYRAIEVGIALAPGSADIGGAYTGAVMSIMRGMEGRGEPVTAQEAAGFVQLVGKTALVADPQKLARSVGPAVAMGIAGGQSPQEAAAQWNAFTLGMEDIEGRISVMAAEAVSRQLPEFLPGVESHQERMDIMAENDALREEFVHGISMRGRGRNTLREMLARKGPGWQAYQNALANAPEFDEAGEQFPKTIAIQQSTQLQKTATLNRILSSSAELIETGNSEAARMAIIRDSLTRILGDVGASKLETQYKQVGLHGDVASRADPLDAFIDIIESKESQLRTPTSYVEGLSGGRWGGGSDNVPIRTVYRPPSDREVQQADDLHSLVVGLTDWQTSQQEHTDALRENTAAMNRNNAKPHPYDVQLQRLSQGEP